tara:strand:+ start:3721 stop:3909 length:189 start_codon:yes stop_codon:yes gene_type:complete
MKVGDLVKYKSYLRGRAYENTCGTIVKIEYYAKVAWWDKDNFIPNPTFENPRDLKVICKGEQ